MEVFSEFLSGIDNLDHRARTEEMFEWIAKTFPSLEPKIGWNQPMFTDHGTYIIGFSTAKPHMSVAPERAGIVQFADEIAKAGYSRTDLLFRIPWKSPINFELLERIITFNIEDKADCATFWRK